MGFIVGLLLGLGSGIVIGVVFDRKITNKAKAVLSAADKALDNSHKR